MKSRSLALLTALAATTAMVACSSNSNNGGGGNPPANKPVGTIDSKALAPTTIPSINDGTPLSADRRLIDEAVARADRENKAIVLDMSAAWCGPCQSFAYDFQKDPNNLKSLTDSGVIFIKGEYENSTTGSQFGLNDYMPMFTRFFPSFYIYQPNIGWEFLGPYNSFKDLQEGLVNRGKSYKMTLPELKAHVDASGTAKTALSSGAEGVRWSGTTSALSAFVTYDEAKELLKYMRDSKEKYPDLQLEEIAKYLESSMSEYVQIGATSAEQFKADYPDQAASFDNPMYQQARRIFGMRLAMKMRAAGTKVAAAQCDALATEARAILVKGTVTEELYQKSLQAYDADAVLLCATLDVRANGVSDAVRAKVAAVDPKMNDDFSLEVALGNKDRAKQIYAEGYAGYPANYDKYIAETRTKIEKARDEFSKDKSTENQKKIDDALVTLAVLEFQKAHHAEVKAEADEALSAGHTPNALKVLN